MKTSKLLTASRIKQAAQLAVQAHRDVWLSDDCGVRGTGRLLLRITASGVKRFYFRCSLGGKRKTASLGPYSRTRHEHFLTIAQARSAAHAAALATAHAPGSELSAPSKRSLPNGGTTASTPTSVPPGRFTVMDLCNAYASHLRSQKKLSARGVETAFLRHIKPSAVASVEASEATADQFASILRGIVMAGHGVSASKLRSELHSAYAHAIKAKLDPSALDFAVDPQVRANPIREIASLSEYSKPGERFLNRIELAEFWSVLHHLPEAKLKLAHRFVRLSVELGGQRAKQLLRVQAKDVDLSEGLVLLLDPKGKRLRPREHLLPAGPAAIRELQWLLRYAADVGSPFLFTGVQTGAQLHEGTISKEVRKLSADLVGAGRIDRPFRYADLRRTIETTLASLSVSKDVRAQIQSHGLSGLQTRHYDRYDYIKEKRDALLLWERFLASLLTPPDDRPSQQERAKWFDTSSSLRS